jgi:hypothetical protein
MPGFCRKFRFYGQMNGLGLVKIAFHNGCNFLQACLFFGEDRLKRRLQTVKKNIAGNQILPINML